MDVSPIRAFREKEQLSQGQLAKLLDVSRPTVTRWEAGTRKVDQEKVPRVSDITGIPRDVLRPDLAAIFNEAAE